MKIKDFVLDSLTGRPATVNHQARKDQEGAIKIGLITCPLLLAFFFGFPWMICLLAEFLGLAPQ